MTSGSWPEQPQALPRGHPRAATGAAAGRYNDIRARHGAKSDRARRKTGRELAESGPKICGERATCRPRAEMERRCVNATSTVSPAPVMNRCRMGRVLWSRSRLKRGGELCDNGKRIFEPKASDKSRAN